jgi:hypothetical protein
VVRSTPPEARARTTDGATFLTVDLDVFFDTGTISLERLEVRAFGHLIEDLLVLVGLDSGRGVFES